MIRTIARAGDRFVVELPDVMIRALHLDEGNDIDIVLHQEADQIVISPRKPDLADIDVEFAKQVADFVQKYRPALQALAR